VPCLNVFVQLLSADIFVVIGNIIKFKSIMMVSETYVRLLSMTLWGHG